MVIINNFCRSWTEIRDGKLDDWRVISKQPGTIDLAKSIQRKYRFILVNATLLFQFSDVPLYHIVAS